MRETPGRRNGQIEATVLFSFWRRLGRETSGRHSGWLVEVFREAAKYSGPTMCPKVVYPPMFRHRTLGSDCFSLPCYEVTLDVVESRKTKLSYGKQTSLERSCRYFPLLPSDDGSCCRRTELRMCHADSCRAAAAATAVAAAATAVAAAAAAVIAARRCCTLLLGSGVRCVL